MSLIQKALITAWSIIATGEQIASAEPSVPDLKSYEASDVQEYTRCSDTPGGPSHCGISFRSEDGFYCGMVSVLAEAHCFDTAGLSEDGGSVREYSVKTAGTPTIFVKHLENGSSRDEAQILQPLHKLSFKWGVAYAPPTDQLSCGVVEDGSVSCQNIQGHGFVLSHDGSKTW
ncbi:hypothetical protein [Segniliparus rugosus]|nr:hypothetical protein [Segniliparus rugosus]